MFEGILAWISAKGVALGIGIAIPFIYKFCGNWITKFIGDAGAKYIGKGMENLDAIDDPILKKLYQNLALDFVKVAEYLVPDRGMGETKFNMVAESMCKMIPLLKGQEERLRKLIDSAVIAMDVELKGAVDILKQ
jgi:hypothetical protein